MEKCTLSQVLDLMQIDEVAIKVGGNFGKCDLEGYTHLKAIGIGLLLIMTIIIIASIIIFYPIIVGFIVMAISVMLFSWAIGMYILNS